MRTLLGILVAATMLWAVACEKHVSPVASTEMMIETTVAANNTGYTAYDTLGNAVVTGTMTIDASDSSSVTGTWVLDSTAVHYRIGPQVGSGTLRGSLHNGVLTVDLNPGWADNNVFLSGTYSGSTYSGTWYYSTFVGTVSRGTFVVRW